MRKVSLAICLAIALGLTACGEKEEVLKPGTPSEFELLLDFFPNADHAGIYAALAGGHFERAGLDVKVRQPADPAAVLRLLAAGRADLAISYEPEVFVARDKGLSVKAVGALVQVPLTSIMSLPQAGVRSAADLEGKTVGTAGIDYQSAYLRTILLEAGVQPDSVKERNIGFGFSQALLTRKADATLGAFWNYEGTQLRLKGREPRIIRMEQAGVPSYDELVLVANEDALERDAGRIRSFIAGLARGTAELTDDPEQAIAGLLEANRDLDEELERAALKATLPLFQPPKGRPYGWQDPQEWEAFAAWMHENRLLEEAPAARDAFTNEYLPGEGL